MFLEQDINDGFAKLAPKVGIVDDQVIGFIVNHMLRIPFTDNHLFHSQYENMSLIRDLEKQVTLGYWEKNDNYLDVDGFSKEEDPNRFRSLHCKINPEEDMCRILKKRKSVLIITSLVPTHLIIVIVSFITLTVIAFRCKRRNSRREKNLIS